MLLIITLILSMNSLIETSNGKLSSIIPLEILTIKKEIPIQFFYIL
jgi:hypothetical protein